MAALESTAYLEIEAATNATFELNIGLEYASDLTKSFVMGSRGQYIREIVNQSLGSTTIDTERRTGYWLDGGAGDWGVTLSFETGLEDVVWGDQDGGTGPSNVTATDASGADVPAIDRLQVLQYWLAKTRSDSLTPYKLHFGQWTDGSIAHVTGVSAGVRGEPMPVAATEDNLSLPDPNSGQQTSMEGSLTVSHVAPMDQPDWATDVIQAIQNAASEVPTF